MASANLWAIVRAIERDGEITPRKVCRLLGCDSKKASRMLEHLVSVGAVKNVGQRGHPVFRMRPAGETRIKPMLAARELPSITDICRKNWRGYQIHKIIGSTRA